MIGALLWSAREAKAQTAEGDWLMRVHIEWITQNSELTYHGEPLPTMYLVSDEELWYTVYGRARTDAERESNFAVNAIYDHTTRSVLVPESYDLMDGTTAHFLVHELVHYLQDINGVLDTECVSNNEALAYDLHHDWMEQYQTGGEPTDPLFRIFVTMGCDDHSGMGYR